METPNKARFGPGQSGLSAYCTTCLVAPIRAYQFFISPWLGHRCRFEPSCSNYAIAALREHGAVKGCGLSLLRLSKCHPWHAGGYDPVPSSKTPPDNGVSK